MKKILSETKTVLQQTFKEFSDDNCSRMAAALAYYTIFSLPPLLVLIISVVGIFVDPADVQGEIEAQIQRLIGTEGATQVQDMIVAANEKTQGNVWGWLLGTAALIFGATGAFMQLQGALNTAWQVQPKPDNAGLLRMIMKRLLSFGMVLGIAFLLLVSLVLSAALAAFGGFLANLLPGGVSQGILVALNVGITLVIIAFLFAAIFKILPDARITWRDVGVGATVTALLFVLGKFAIGFYLGTSDVGSTYGAAGSLALILTWIYYSAMILLLGAEFTQVWTCRYGTRIQPAEDAVRVVEKPQTVEIPPDAASSQQALAHADMRSENSSAPVPPKAQAPPSAQRVPPFRTNVFQDS